MTTSRNIYTRQQSPSSMARTANNIFRNRKVFNDPIHGHIALHPVCVRIIDTPQFQRLRFIKQLDACYLVYPGASHNRFEHSLGVCFLAGKLMNTLRDRQPDLKITDRDILCVEIAGLCHDLGQGPFSHVYEKRFMRKMKKPFTHEGAAVKMFKHMLGINNENEDDENEDGDNEDDDDEENDDDEDEDDDNEDEDDTVGKDIQKIIKKCKIPRFKSFKKKDFIFIEELIGDPKDIENGEWPYKGRDKDKSFMYEIVANKRNGIDVDKWDYIARDSYMLGIKVNFDHNRCFASARVLEANGELGENGSNGRKWKQICYRDTSAQDLYDMFYTRMTLHRRAYQHKTHNIIGIMICDAMMAADEHFKIAGKRFSEMLDDDDMEAYTQFTDDVIQMISNTHASQEATENTQTPTDDVLEPARTIIQKILNRKLYKCVAQTQCEKGTVKNEDFKAQFIEILKKDENSVQENSVEFDIINLDYGMGEEDPMKKVKFYCKDDIDIPVELSGEQVSFILPKTFAEHIVRIYCKRQEENTIGKVREAFGKWCRKYKHPLPKDVKQKKPLRSQQRGDQDSQPPPPVDNQENKQLPEYADVTTGSAENGQQPMSYHGGGVDTRAEQASSSGETHD